MNPCKEHRLAPRIRSRILQIVPFSSIACAKQSAILIAVILLSGPLTTSSTFSCQAFLAPTSTIIRKGGPSSHCSISHLPILLSRRPCSTALTSTPNGGIASDVSGDWNAPSALYDADPSDHRYSASDWWHNMKSLPRSSILREIKGPVLALMAWSTLISAVHQSLLLSTKTAPWAKFLCISSTPHSFLVSALGLLLVFRTNSAYQRFAEGRLIWENILSISRNMSRMAILYQRELGNNRLQRVLQLLAAFPYLLRHHIQPQCLDVLDYHQRQQKQQQDQSTNINSLLLLEEPINKKRRSLGTTSSTAAASRRRRLWTRFRWNGVKGKDGDAASTNHDVLSSIETKNCDCWVDTRSVPWCLLPTGTLDKCISSSNRPLWICDRLSQELTNVAYTPNFTSRERLTFLSQVDKLSICIGECERIQQTAVPLNYARHSIRSLTIWLVSLPFALVGDLGMLTGPVMGVISWLLLGVYQIGYTIEDPFQRALRLSILCDAIYRDVMCETEHMERRQSAFDGVKESNGLSTTPIAITSTFASLEEVEDEEEDPLALMKLASDQDPTMFPRP